MKKNIVTLIIFTIIGIAYSQSVKNFKEMTKEERLAWAAERQLERYKKTGGVIVKPGSRKGSVAIINQQTKLPECELIKVLEILKKDSDITHNIFTAKAGTSPADALKESGATFGIIIIDDSSKPSMLVATDDRWATLNIAKYSKGIPQGKLSYIPFYTRCRKGILRAYAVLIGGARSQFPGNILAVTSIEDLDTVGEFIPGDVQMTIRQNFKDNGVTAETKAPYIRACKEGWAPAPTNEVQKAIWDRVKSEKERGPSNALKIRPPKK